MSAADDAVRAAAEKRGAPNGTRPKPSWWAHEAEAARADDVPPPMDEDAPPRRGPNPDADRGRKPDRTAGKGSTQKAPNIRPVADYAGEIATQADAPTLDWGFATLNRKAELPLSALATLSGPTGGGKTSFAAQVAAHRCRYSGKPNRDQGPTVWLKAELTGAQLAAKFVAQRRRCPWITVLKGDRSGENRGTLEELQLFVVEVPRHAKVIDLAKRALDEVARVADGVPLLVLDYLQKCRGEGRDIREATTALVDDFAALVESRSVYGLLLSKGSRGSSQRMRDGKTRGEKLVDVGAETNAIEHASTVQLAITFEDRTGEAVVDARLEIAKTRYGATGASVGYRFHGAEGWWEELDQVPLTKAERTALASILTAAGEKGFESRNALYKAVGGTKQTALKLIERELEPGGKLELRDGLIRARREP